MILIRAGLYAEKVFITKRHVALVGEDRKRTRIVFAELRKNWRKDHSDDWGAAVINIGDTVTDLVIANLTVHDDYGSLHGDHDHQFAIRSGGAATRLSLLSVDIVADGGNTLSLWNTATGMYYLADSYFEGYVDFVCPRGWCYAADSRFFGHNTSASIWHDGNLYEDSKFVIGTRASTASPASPSAATPATGSSSCSTASSRRTWRTSRSTRPPAPRPFSGRFARTSGTRAVRADRSPGSPTTSASPRVRPPPRTSTRAGRLADGGGPGGTVSAVLPFAAIPRPRHRGVAPADVTLRWLAAREAKSYEVFLGDSTRRSESRR